MKRFYWIASILLLSILLLMNACRSKEQPKEPILEGDNFVLASVNGSAITKYDLKATIKSGPTRFIGESPGKAMRKKILESMVHQKVLAEAQDKKLTPKERAQLDKLVAAYREKLLAQMYLNKSELMRPVTSKEIDAYYQSHPKEFGADKIVKYELLMTQRSLALSERKTVLDRLTTAKKAEDWRSFAQTASGDKFPVVYRRGVSTAASLQGKLRNVVLGLNDKEISDVTIIDGKAFLVRALSVERVAPESLLKVSPRIRTQLEALEMKRALKQAVDKELKGAKVKYL